MMWGLVGHSPDDGLVVLFSIYAISARETIRLLSFYMFLNYDNNLKTIIKSLSFLYLPRLIHLVMK